MIFLLEKNQRFATENPKTPQQRKKKKNQTTKQNQEFLENDVQYPPWN